MHPSPADAIIIPTHPTLPKLHADPTGPESHVRYATLPDPNDLLCGIFYTQDLLYDPG